jgi:hypothetical protein
MAVRFGKGTKLQRETAPASGVFADIPGLQNISGPAETVPRNDITTHDTAGNRREFQAGLQDEASIRAEIGKYDPLDATHILLHADMSTAGGNPVNWRLVAPPSVSPTKYRAFVGFVSSYSPEFPVGSQLTASLEVTITGDITPWT